MIDQHFSRRKFLHGITAGSTGAALGSLPGVLSTQAAETGAEALSPVTAVSYPIAEPGKGANVARLKIATRAKIPEDYQEKLRAFFSGVALNICGSPEEFHQEVADADAIYGGFSREDLSAAKQLKWIQWTAAGVEGILWPELVNSPIVLTNMQRMFAPTISETVIGLLLSLTRGLNRYVNQTREHKWARLDQLKEISGMTMGIVGLGGNGTEIAYRAFYGFDMKILAVDPKPLPKPEFVSELHSLDWFPKMVSQVDVLVSAAPHTPLTFHLFNEGVFRSMKPGSYFINIARGALVDSPALIHALQEGWIAGAGLDVVHKEPLPPEDPLWNAPNLIITSHSSAVSAGTDRRLLELLTENVRRYLNGLPLLNVVDKKRGY